MNRRSFLLHLGWAPWALGAAIALVSGCSGDDGTPYGKTSSNPTTGDCDGVAPDSVSVSAGHTHAVCLPQATLDNPQAVPLTLEAGATGHSHTISLSQQQVTDIRDGTATVTATSTSTGHTHDVTFL